MITGHTALLPIVADPVTHVRTPAIFNAYLADAGIDAVVVPVHVRAEALRRVVDGMRATQNQRAIIVTVPHKIAIVELCDELHDSARLAGAVNLVRREPDGRLVGANFDGTGFVAALEAELGSVAGKDVYLAGAGGVARAIAFALARAGVARLAIANRSAAKADALCAAVKAAYPAVATTRGQARPALHDIAINGTSVGLKPDDPLPFAVDDLPAHAAVAEVVMNPPVTPLLARAQARGLAIVLGDAMLRFQLAAWVDFLGLSEERQ